MNHFLYRNVEPIALWELTEDLSEIIRVARPQGTVGHYVWRQEVHSKRSLVRAWDLTLDRCSASADNGIVNGLKMAQELYPRYFTALACLVELAVNVLQS